MHHRQHVLNGSPESQALMVQAIELPVGMGRRPVPAEAPHAWKPTAKLFFRRWL